MTFSSSSSRKITFKASGRYAPIVLVVKVLVVVVDQMRRVRGVLHESLQGILSEELTYRSMLYRGKERKVSYSRDRGLWARHTIGLGDPPVDLREE